MTCALFTGASRSGKTALAMGWAERHAAHCLYIATAEHPAGDDPELAARIARHQAERGPAWQTLELFSPHPDAPGSLPEAVLRSPVVAGKACAVLVDCTSLWIARLMETLDDAAVLRQVDALAASLTRASHPVAVVHGETGWGVVPDTPLGRRFRDLSGLTGQRLAQACDVVFLAVCGLPLPLKGRVAGAACGS